MPAIRAERLCPGAIFVPPDFTRYRAVSLLTREIFKRHTDLVEPSSLDEAYLDVTQYKTWFADRNACRQSTGSHAARAPFWTECRVTSAEITLLLVEYLTLRRSHAHSTERCAPSTARSEMPRTGWSRAKRC